jgi:hypothetical protein
VRVMRAFWMSIGVDAAGWIYLADTKREGGGGRVALGARLLLGVSA